jgi:hypothetical protein
MRGIFLIGLLYWLFPVQFQAQAQPAALQQREQSFVIHLNAPVAQVTPLFGPLREADWAPTWKPRFIHLPGGEQREGAVFTATNADGRERLWLLTTYDVDHGRIEYVVVVPGLTANQIKIRVVSDGENHSQATITYRHSAIGPEGNKEVAKLDEHWAEQQRAHWERAINGLLDKGGRHD